MKELETKIVELGEEIKSFLLNNLDKLVLTDVDTHYVIYSLDDYIVKIWTANGKEGCGLYDNFVGFDADYIKFSDEEKTILWDKAQGDKSGTGEKRLIQRTQMRNDLYFSFDGVFGKVKFSGYNDSNWWDNHVPTSIKENDEITWDIDLKKMVATYKPKNV